MKSKKGQMSFQQFWEVMQALLLITLLVLSILFINQHKKGTYIETTYLTRDMSLLISVSLASQGNIFYLYPKDLSKLQFDYLIEGNYVKMKSRDDQIWTSYPFITSNSQNISDFRQYNITSIIINKKGDKLSLSTTPVHNLNAINCPRVDTYNPNSQSEKIGVEAGDNINQIKQYLSQARSSFVERQQGDNPDYRIALYTYNSTNANDNGVTAYVDANSQSLRRSQKLACNILNSISESLQVTHSSLVLVETGQLDKNSDMYRFFDNAKVSVYLKYANANITNNPLLQDYPRLAKSISIGTQNYFA